MPTQPRSSESSNGWTTSSGLNRESIRLTEARVREGDAAPLERQLLAVDLSRAEAERLSTAGQLDAILIELKQLVGISPSEQLTLAPSTASQ